MRSRHRDSRESRDRREGCLIWVIIILGIGAIAAYGYVAGR